jgi:PREDICTED: similar to threonine aspartase 1 (taspase-1)
LYKKYKKDLDNQLKKSQKPIERLDTVGAVAIDKFGYVAAGVSSGGILLKWPGRVGHASAYGCGCWAQDNVAVSSSGMGEYLVKTFFAKECANALIHCSNKDYVNQMRQFFVEKFLSKLTIVITSVNNKHFNLICIF